MRLFGFTAIVASLAVSVGSALAAVPVVKPPTRPAPTMNTPERLQEVRRKTQMEKQASERIGKIENRGRRSPQ